MYPLWDQIKAYMQSISGIVHKQADTLEKTAATANEAHETALYSKKRIDGKMDAVNPTGTGSFSLGRYMNPQFPVGENSIAMGERTFATKKNSIAIGDNANSNNISSIAIGSMADARAIYSSAIGNTARTDHEADYATAIGSGAVAYGGNSVAIGSNVEANYKDQTVLGVNSKTISNTHYPNERGKYSFILGNGSAVFARSNAMTIDWNGNAWFQGEVYVGGEDQEDENASKLIAQKDIGKGLKMDGDALTVDEGEYELIETIVLEESVSEVVRTEEPNGTPYNFSAFMVATEHPNADFGGNYAPMYVYPGRGNNGWVSCGLPFANTNTKYATRSIFRLIGNFWDVYGYHGEATAASTMVGQTSAQRLISKGDLPSISYLKIFAGGGVKFSPEMIIKIYGVRA